MFDKLRQGAELLRLRAKANKLQKELQEVTATVAKNGIEVRVRGDQKVDSIKYEGEERRDLVDLINEAMKEVQKKSAKKMMEMEGGLSGLLGKL